MGLFTPSVALGVPLQERLDLSHAALRVPEHIRDTLSPPRWLPEGERFVYWSMVDPHRETWVLVDAQRKTQQPLLSPDVLRTQLTVLLGKPPRLSGFMPFTLTPDARGIAFSVQGQPFTLGLTDRRVVALAPTDPVALSLRPGNALSPDGRAVAEQRDAGFAVVDAQGKARVERDGTEDNAWRIPESAWSPQGRFLAVWREDSRAVHRIPLVDYGTALEKVSWAPYSKTGTPLMRSELHVINVESGQGVAVPRAETEGYEWFAGWRPDGREAFVLRLSRDGKRLDLMAVDATTGKSRRVLREERPETFVGALDFALEGWSRQLKALPDNQHFLWMSERDGWRHVYLYDYSGRLVRQLTKGPFPVHAVLGVAPKADTVFVLASAEREAPYDRLLGTGSHPDQAAA